MKQTQFMNSNNKGEGGRPLMKSLEGSKFQTSRIRKSLGAQQRVDHQKVTTENPTKGTFTYHNLSQGHVSEPIHISQPRLKSQEKQRLGANKGIVKFS